MNNITLKFSGLRGAILTLLFALLFNLSLFSDVSAISTSFFRDSFDTYRLGTIDGQGGWRCLPGSCFGEFDVIDTLFNSFPQALRIQGLSNRFAGDLVRDFPNVIWGRQTLWFHPIGSTYVRINTQGDHLHGFMLEFTDDPTNPALININQWAGARLFSGVAKNRWHFLEITFDSRLHRFSVRLNNTGSWVEGTYFSNPAFLNRIIIQRMFGGQMTFDDFGAEFPAPIPTGGVERLGTLWHEIITLRHNLGFRFFGNNPDGADQLVVRFFKGLALIRSDVINLMNLPPITAPSLTFERDLRVLQLAPGLYTIKTHLFSGATGQSSVVRSFSHSIGGHIPILTETDFIRGATAPPPPPETPILDRWGISDLINRWILRIRERFPFSWIFGIREVWDLHLRQLDQRPAEPIRVVWTLPILTSPGTSAFSQARFTLLDLRGANENWRPQFQLFRTILIYVCWLTYVFLVYNRTRRFLTGIALTHID